MPEFGVVRVSAEEMDKKNKKKSSGKTKSRDPKRVEKVKPTKKSSTGKRKRLQGPGTQQRGEEEVNMQEIVDNLRTQDVLAGRVFEMAIINLPGMDSLHNMVEIQSWMHIFNRKSPILHEEEVREFYYNIQFKEDGKYPYQSE